MQRPVTPALLPCCPAPPLLARRSIHWPKLVPWVMMEVGLSARVKAVNSRRPGPRCLCPLSAASMLWPNKSVYKTPFTCLLVCTFD